MTAVPPGAVTVDGKIVTSTTAAVLSVYGPNAVGPMTYMVPRIIRTALEAAVPLITAAAAAAERERIRQLATDHDAAITKDCECGPHRGGRFADLLER